MTDTTETNDLNVSDRSSGLDENNRFGPGNKMNRLRLTEQRSRVLKKAFQHAVLNEEVEQLAKAMIALALQGDVAAARVVLEYAIGKPTTMEQDVEVNSDTPGQLVIRLISPETKN